MSTNSDVSAADGIQNAAILPEDNLDLDDLKDVLGAPNDTSDAPNNASGAPTNAYSESGAPHDTSGAPEDGSDYVEDASGAPEDSPDDPEVHHVSSESLSSSETYLSSTTKDNFDYEDWYVKWKEEAKGNGASKHAGNAANLAASNPIRNTRTLRGEFDLDSDELVIDAYEGLQKLLEDRDVVGWDVLKAKRASRFLLRAKYTKSVYTAIAATNYASKALNCYDTPDSVFSEICLDIARALGLLAGELVSQASQEPTNVPTLAPTSNPTSVRHNSLLL